MLSSRPLRIAAGLFFLTVAAWACTVAAFGPSSTKDGRPILWKNRDVNDPAQEFQYFDRGGFRFVANTYAGETTHVWAGINEAGFAIMNSDAHNIGGFDRPGDDGLLMFNALNGCATVADFEVLLDSSNEVGREWTANYGVFDSTGLTAMFEAANTWYVRYDASEDPYGMIVRANYAFSGDSNRMSGLERYHRAFGLCTTAYRNNEIDAEWVFDVLARDLALPDLDPYPLPFEGRYQGYAYGCFPTNQALNRKRTVSVEVMVGNRPGEPALTGMMWALAGGPEVGLPVPLWVCAESVPVALDGETTSELSDSAQSLRRYTYPYEELPDLVNTFAVHEVERTFASVESTIFAMTGSAEELRAGRVPTKDEAFALSEEACRLALNAYTRFGQPPVRPDTARKLPTIVGDVLRLRMPAGVGRCDVFDATGRKKATLSSPPGALLRWEARDLVDGSYLVKFPDAPDETPVRFIRISR